MQHQTGHAPSARVPTQVQANIAEKAHGANTLLDVQQAGNAGNMSELLQVCEGTADKDIILKLKAMGSLVDNKNLVHSVPVCWRSDTPLIYKVGITVLIITVIAITIICALHILLIMLGLPHEGNDMK